VFANSIKQTRDQEFAGGMRARQETGDQISGAAAFPLLTRKKRRIDKGAIEFVAAEKTFFEETIESGHYGRVRQRTTELRDNVADIAFAARPEDFHQFEFEAAESQGGTVAATSSDTIFEEANQG